VAIVQKRMVILSLLAYGVYKENQKLLQSRHQVDGELPAVSLAAATTAAIKIDTNAATAAPTTAAIPLRSSVPSKGSTNTTAATTNNAAISESERRKRAVQEWKEKLRVQMEQQQEDMEADSERATSSKDDSQAEKAMQQGERDRQLEKERLLEKIQRMKREKLIEKSGKVPGMEERIQGMEPGGSESLPKMGRGRETEQPKGKEKRPESHISGKGRVYKEDAGGRTSADLADEEVLIASEGRPRRGQARSDFFPAALLEDSGVALLPTAQPGPKNTIKFHLKSLVKSRVEETVELVEPCKEEGEDGGAEEGDDQLAKARNLLRSSQQRLGKNAMIKKKKK
jgi:hypothetical protein